MLCGSKHVQNKDTKDMVISQTEFAVKIAKVPMSPVRKKMRDDPADKAEIHAFRGVSGSIGWLAGQTRRDVSCQVSQLQQTLPQPTVAQVCASSMVVRRVHQHARLGSQDQTNANTKHDVAVACRRVVENWWPCGLAGWILLWRYRSAIVERKECSVSPLAWR